MVAASIKDIEFFRDVLILVPSKNSENFHTVLIPQQGKKKHRLFCNCSVGRDPDCVHARQLLREFQNVAAALDGKSIDGHFSGSVCKALLGAVAKGGNHSIDQLTISTPEGAGVLLVVASGSTPLFHYYPVNGDGKRLIGRLMPGEKFSRAWLINKSSSFVESEYERAMRVSGHKTVRMLEENSVLHRLAYHCFIEFGEERCSWSVSVNRNSGAVSLYCSVEDTVVAEVFLPTKSVTAVLDTLKWHTSTLPQLPQRDYEAELKFIIRKEPQGQVVCTPVVPDISVPGSFVNVAPQFCYGTLGYNPEQNVFYRFSAGSLQRVATGWNRERHVDLSEFAAFVNNNVAALSIAGKDGSGAAAQTDLFGAAECDDLARVAYPPVVRAFDRIELHPIAIRGSQWTIDLNYCCGTIKVNLGALIEARNRKEAYLLTDTCMVEMKSKAVTGALAQARGIGPDGVLTLSSMSLMLMRGESVDLHFDGDEKLIKKIRDMFSGKPRKEIAFKEDFTCTLRPYQLNGVSWLHFLYDYHLGGLLCDEMGLGKTIQIIACINGLRARHRNVSACIVCPTSVISHWIRLFERFSPTLQVVDYAKVRRIPPKTEVDVVVVSYGLMRNDAEILAKTMFDLVVFDEVHQLKNSDTVGYRAACSLRARTAIGLTGTPVENSAEDLTALFNLVLPGLAIDVPSETALLNAINYDDSQTHEVFHFRKRIEPFILRRLKQHVLTDLPPKTEENRYCALSDYQQELYLSALERKGAALLETLRNTEEAVPYMHIFSLLSYLKQLCDTPALVQGEWVEYPLCESGKWELFKELLSESLGSGQKVVVFTQFLAMVDIFSHYLTSLGIDHETLTGATVNREKCIRRFNDDPQCMVFVGSLKAGGVGIDLIAGSVVIHYDRWWNAAREDQATDRVHRIGQTKGVQVFKLITENSLEERIDRIISRKKSIAEHTLTDDDPDTVKLFTREELMDLISR